MLIVDFDRPELVEHPHFVVGFMGCGIVEEVEYLEGSQYPQVLQDFVKVSEFVVIEA